MSTPREDRLKELLRRRTQEVAEQATAHGGDVPQAQLDELSRLARLVELREKAAPRRTQRWQVAAVLAGTLVIASILLFMRVPSTDIEVELQASEVGFTLTRPQVLTQLTNLSELDASGLRAVQLADPALAPTALKASGSGRTAVRVAARTHDQGSSSITLAPLTLPANASVRIFAAAGEGPLRIVLNHAAGSVRATVHGAVRLDLPAESRELDLTMPRSLLLEADSSDVSLQLVSARGSSALFAPQIAVRDLSLSRVDEFQALDGTMAQRVSTVASGAIYFQALNGEKRELRPGELLHFRDVRGALGVLKPEDDHVTIHFRGRVSGLRTGWGEHTASLMPTVLSWLHARHGLSLLWGTTVYLFGLAMVLLRWWKGSA